MGEPGRGLPPFPPNTYLIWCKARFLQLDRAASSCFYVCSLRRSQTGGRYGDNSELALWNGVPALQYLTDRSGWVAVREQTRSLSFLVLRGLRSPYQVGRRLQISITSQLINHVRPDLLA